MAFILQVDFGNITNLVPRVLSFSNMVASGKKTHKTVCLKINPRRSPRGFISVLLAVVCYQVRISPAESDGHLLIYHLFNSLTAAEAKLTNGGIIVAGDYSHSDTNHL